MGISFPKRAQRSSFGPKLVNNYPAENPQSDVPDTALNGMFWGVAGMGLILPRAVVVATYTGGQFVISHQAEAWNPEGDQAHPTLARSAAGRYSYTFAASYLDEDGTAIPTDVRAARATAMRILTTPISQRIEGHAWVDPATPLAAQIALWDENGSVLADHPFWLEVL
jgi:hypothetical protein